MDLPQYVRDTTEWVMTQSTHVRICEDGLASAAIDLVRLREEYIKKEDVVEGGWQPMADWDWDMHFFDGTALTVQYLLVLDALNFCFWPVDGLEYDDLSRALKRVLLDDGTAFQAQKLMNMDEETLRRWLGFDLPTMPQRVQALRQIGSGLLAFDGCAGRLVESAQGSASTLVRLITTNFPAFQDHAVYKGQQVFFYKRAQIFVADVWGAFKGQGYGRFHDVDCLTMFADYRVPQILREWNVLRYSEELAQRVDQRQVLAASSEEETEIRAATVQAVERLRGLLKAKGVDTISIHIDWLLWQKGESLRNEIGPHHRTLTIFY